jgi:hypothetical protein
VIQHELRLEDWRRLGGKDAYAVSMVWYREGKAVGEVRAVVSGQAVRGWRTGGGDIERWKQALTSWAVGQLEAEVKGGRERAALAEGSFELDADVAAVQRLATSDTDLPELVEGEVVGSFATGSERPEAPGM